jgi:aminopeptidase
VDPPTLARYADLVISSCLRVEPGEVVGLHGEPAHRDLLVALSAAAYQAGARLVDTQFVEQRLRRGRVDHSRPEYLELMPPWHEQRMRWLVRERAALVSINGPGEPSLMNGTDPARAIREHTSRVPGNRAYARAVQTGDLRFCVVSWALPGWATTAYPELSPDAAADRVQADLAAFCRVGPDDPAGAWDSHVDGIAARAAALTALDLEQLRFRGPGTDLEVGFSEGTRWAGGEEATSYGVVFRPNAPTEEVFTSPDPRRTTGTFTCTRPLTLDGRRIEGIRGSFRAGRIVEVHADDPDDRDYLAAHVARDRGAGRLGEVALVDASSRVGSTGRTYGITLIDENAASHIAFGHGYDVTRLPGAPRTNSSHIHTDVMIGGPEIEVTGVTRNGRRIDVIRDGTFASGL